MSYAGIWRKYIPVIRAGYEHGISPAKIADFLVSRGVEHVDPTGAIYVPGADNIRYIAQREGLVKKSSRKVIPTPSFILDPDGDGLRDQWIDFDWAKM